MGALLLFGVVDRLLSPASRRENFNAGYTPPTHKLPLEDMNRDELVADVNHLRRRPIEKGCKL